MYTKCLKPEEGTYNQVVIQDFLHVREEPYDDASPSPKGSSIHRMQARDSSRARKVIKQWAMPIAMYMYIRGSSLRKIF